LRRRLSIVSRRSPPNSSTYCYSSAQDCFFFSSRRRHTRSLRDWSSDVCSSDLLVGRHHEQHQPNGPHPGQHVADETFVSGHVEEIGRASCRERVEISVVAV